MSDAHNAPPPAGPAPIATDLPRHARERIAEMREKKLFTSVHLRSARITHLLEATGNLPGTQFMAGHKHTTTTARYVKPSLRAAEAMLGQIAKPARRARGK